MFYYLIKYLEPCLYYTLDLTHQIPQGIRLFTTFQQIQSGTSNVKSLKDVQGVQIDVAWRMGLLQECFRSIEVTKLIYITFR